MVAKRDVGGRVQVSVVKWDAGGMVAKYNADGGGLIAQQLCDYNALLYVYTRTHCIYYVHVVRIT